VSVIKDTVEKLHESGCVKRDGDGVDFLVTPTVLGNAAASFYLTYRTPKQMQMGVREARKILIQTLEKSDADEPDNAVVQPPGNTGRTVPFSRSPRVDEITIAWLLYTLSSTHEFDELPVRHTEENLNQELSERLMWGPDTSALMSGNKPYYNEDIFSDPHTKGFLLIQAHLERAKLPISDYVNDTKSIVENIPRLLAAMRFIAAFDNTTAGSFELLTQFSRTKQILETRSLVDDDPLLQLPGFSSDAVRRMRNGTASKRNDDISISEMRALSKRDASDLMQRLFTGRGKQASQIDRSLDALYAFPMVTVTNASVRSEVNKTTGKNTGKLKIVLDVQREKRKSFKNNEGYTLILILGSWQQRMLLSDTSVRLTRSGSWTITKELTFDWAAANADGGIDGGKMALRLLFDEIRGFDMETTVNLK
jgi:hypothetical protein